MLKDKINKDLIAAMKAREEIKVSTLRMLNAAVKNAAIAKKAKELKDDEIVEVISKQLKQRNDSIEQYKKGGRQDLAEKEEKELGILKLYLPQQLSADELSTIIKEAIKSAGASGPKDMGKVMKELMPKVKGRADNKLISQLVQQQLQG